ncbi:hypothetical protein NW756_001450 [Fusarium oxysporum]|nr:hypothetical protein NW763_008163 [Fusarium oxysporum]KAJ4069122.1 hypothetical protein NW753_000003 [Fusarium oxysporum]KAJ4101040.1 hypothetical protein NW756_001450 [Fusarium oxysporum]KAJ4118545.1 hypothetical protein NW769_003349 [Fusarium oxysporum]KAJ4227840.1 hypothetical protein NW760_008546 [Fusarium oxysporum]
MYLPANLKAAQAVISSRLCFQRGLAYDLSKQLLSLREAEKHYLGSKHITISRIVKKLEAVNTLLIKDIPNERIGRLRLLTDEEEEAIVAFVIWMQKSGLPAFKYEVKDAANTLRRRRDPEA